MKILAQVNKKAPEGASIDLFCPKALPQFSLVLPDIVDWLRCAGVLPRFLDQREFSGVVSTMALMSFLRFAVIDLYSLEAS